MLEAFFSSYFFVPVGFVLRLLVMNKLICCLLVTGKFLLSMEYAAVHGHHWANYGDVCLYVSLLFRFPATELMNE
jgi:hypothetical protein